MRSNSLTLTFLKSTLPPVKISEINSSFSPADDKQLDSFQLRMPSQLILVSSKRTQFSVYTWGILISYSHRIVNPNEDISEASHLGGRLWK